jgi:carboxymethylenebutenolidase
MIAAPHPDRIAALGGFHAGRMVTDDEDSPHRLAPRVRGRFTGVTPTRTRA